VSAPAALAERLVKDYPKAPWPLRRGGRRALSGIGFSLRPGEVVGLIGPNGAGKSTLLRILAGLLLPTEGRAEVNGRDVVRDRPHSRAEVGLAIGEDKGLSPRLSVRENLRFFAALYGLARATGEARIIELAEAFEAGALLEREVRTLSGGERARVALARAMLHRPKLLLLDEVTRPLDPGAAKRLRQVIARTAGADGTCVLFSSHDLAEVEAIAGRVLLLDHGALVADGPFAAVRAEADRVFALEAA
jgi:ABC-2 type transport system ATP-binding protein